MVIRIPNLPNGQIVDDKGNATDDEITFRQALISQLQNNFGDEGCVVPTQAYADMLTIQNHQNDQLQYTCAFGTCLYVPDFDVLGTPTISIVFAIDNGAGVPIFKRVSLL